MLIATLRRCWLLSVLVLALPIAGAARPGPVMQDWLALMDSAGCTGPHRNSGWGRDAIIATALGHARMSLAEASDRAGVDLLDFVMEGGQLDYLEGNEDLEERILTAAASGLDAARALADHPGFCAQSHILGGESLHDRAMGQQGHADHYAPDQKVAQTLLILQGCLDGAADGVLGPASLAAWQKAAPERVPTGGIGSAEVLALIDTPAERLTCDLASPSPSTGMALALLNLAADCYGVQNGKMLDPQLSLPLTGVVAAGDRAALRQGVDAILGLCATDDPYLGAQMAADLALGLRLAYPDDPVKAAALAVALLQAIPSDDPDQTTPLDMVRNRTHQMLDDPGALPFAAALVTALAADMTGLPLPHDLPDLAGALLARNDLAATDRAALLAAVQHSPVGLSLPGILAARVDAALAGEEDPAALALALAVLLDRRITPNYTIFDLSADGDEDSMGHVDMLRVEATVTFPGIGPLMNLARLVAQEPAAGDALAGQASGPVAFMTASTLLEGFSGQPRSADLTAIARRLMQRAADQGMGMAALRLAQMAENGLGGPVDPALADAAYRAAADAGQPMAYLALAARAEAAGDADRALDLYARAYGLRGAKGMDVADVLALTARVAQGEGLFATPAGRGLETALQDRFVDAGWGVGMARDIALALLDDGRGLPPDPGRAVDWLRLGLAVEQARPAGEGDSWSMTQAQRLLARILQIRPALAERPMPAGLPPLRLTPVAPEDAGWAACTSPWSEEIETCTMAALHAAVGGQGNAQIAPALDWLARHAAEETRVQRRGGSLTQPGDLPYFSRRAVVSAGRALALAWWGDWAGAQAAAQPFASLPFDLFAGPHSDQFRRITARWLEGRAPLVWPGFLDMVTVFAARGDAPSREILSLVAAVAAGGPVRPDAPPDLASARADFAMAEPLGTGSPGMALAARRLAPLEAAAGERLRAVELELMALNTDLDKADLDSILHGPVPGDMTRICGWSHASERFLAMGETDLAVTLAELAVNRLQALRGALRDVPENLQLCFRDQVTDHYRWLAGLYLQAGRAGDADRVLMLLKDFETFRFVSRDADLAARAAVALAPEADGAAFGAAIAPLRPTVTAQALRRRALLLQQKSAPLPAAALAELAALNAGLAEAAAARETAVAAIIEAAAAQGEARAATAAALAEGKTIKRRLREMGARAAALQYVVLDGQLGIVLTTPVSQTIFMQDRLGDLPLDKADLAGQVADFRAALSGPTGNPLPLAQAFGDLLLPAALRAELAAADIDRLVLSLDGPLRYLPFAALHDGQRWLVEDYVLTHATGGAMGAGGADVAALAAFGVTRALHGMSALPGVAQELAGISGPEGAALPATVWLDDDFGRDRLAAALVFGDGFDDQLGVLHLASHFKLGRTEAESFLLMGDGGLLSVADLRDGLGADLDFSELGLLTLSACETGFGGPGDGAELESFAAVAQDAGARSVAATLWPVNDHSVSLLMQDFYRGAFPEGGGGGDLALALAEAQRRMIGAASGETALNQRGAGALEEGGPVWSGHAHPWHWAPLILLEGAG